MAKKNPNHKRNALSYTNALGAAYAKDPTPERAEELLSAFQGLIKNYVNLLSPTHSINPNDRLTKNTKEFLRLFASKKELQQNESMAYHKVLRRLPNMAKQSLFDDEDLEQSITEAFLRTAQNFDQAKCGDDGTFTGYINKTFKYTLKPLLFHSHEDAANYQSLYPEILDDQLFFGRDVDFEEECTRIHNGYDIIDGTLVNKYIDLPSLSLSFISMPSPPFDTILTKQERRVMIKLLVDSKSASATAEELGYSNATTVRNMFESAIQKIREHFGVTEEDL